MAGFMITAAPAAVGNHDYLRAFGAFKRKGLNPLARKCGPDYIDGLFHKQVLELEGMNLTATLRRRRNFGINTAVSKGHLPVVEGVTGYFDGLGRKHHKSQLLGGGSHTGSSGSAGG